MLRVLLVTSRTNDLKEFANALAADPGATLEQARKPAEALESAKNSAPHLVVVDGAMEGVVPKDMARELIMVNALVNTAVLTEMDEDEFHEAFEGLGIMANLPLAPGAGDATRLLAKLRSVTGAA